jgi:S-formylglutathione hydrolase FrmB
VLGLSRRPERRDLFDRVFDGRVPPEDDLFALLAQADVDTLPSMYVGCGTEDELYDGNVRFVDQAVADGVDVQVDFRAGQHEWGLWDRGIRDVLAWLPIGR